jgi:hypothetical protein
MAIILKRQLTESEKQQILTIHGRMCFATGHPIPDGDPIQFDHIRAYSEGGPSELSNIGPMCETHNKQKGALPLLDFRVKLRLQQFFSNGDRLTLKHLLRFLHEEKDIPAYGQPVVATEHNGVLRLEAQGSVHEYTLCRCPTTGWSYFYATLPVEILDSDDDEDQRVGLQPRYLIFDKVFELFRHFQRHPVLLPSIGRLCHNRIVLFDGQHKIAGLLWADRREFECKVYISPDLDLRLLSQTNISAHDKFAQTRFYASVMVEKLGQEFGTAFEEYRNLEDGATKTEAGFMQHLERDPAQTMTRGERNERFRNYLYNLVLQHPDNRMTPFVSVSNRGTDESPITIDMLKKSLLARFLYTEPVDDDMALDTYHRDVEIENNVALMNMLYDLALHAWNPKAGPNSDRQRLLVRLFRSKSIMAWAELLGDAVCARLELFDGEDRERPFYRELSETEMGRVRHVVQRLVDWTGWLAPAGDEIDRVLSDNKSRVKEWLKARGLSTGYLMGAPE